MSDTKDGQRWHDMGGNSAGPIPPTEHDFSLWEKRVDALMILCSGKGYFTVDGLRRALEDMGETAFETMSYYERWIAAINQNLVEKGAYSLEELGAKMLEIQKRGATYGDASLGAETSSVAEEQKTGARNHKTAAGSGPQIGERGSASVTPSGRGDTPADAQVQPGRASQDEQP